MKSYFQDREVAKTSKFDKVSTCMEKGCPLGSILGPMAWNWCKDELLNKITSNYDEEEVELTAYADDLAILIKNDTRKAIENVGKNIIKMIAD